MATTLGAVTEEAFEKRLGTERGSLRAAAGSAGAAGAAGAAGEGGTTTTPQTEAPTLAATRNTSLTALGGPKYRLLVVDDSQLNRKMQVGAAGSRPVDVSAREFADPFPRSPAPP